MGLFSTLDKDSGLGKQIGFALLTGFGLGQTLQPSVLPHENTSHLTGHTTVARGMQTS